MPAGEDRSIRSGAIRRSIERLEPGEWVTVTAFLNSWVNFDATSATDRRTQYRKDGDSVEIRGVVKSGGAGTIIFVLPKAFRPQRLYNFPAPSSTGYGQVSVTRDGEVKHASGGVASFFLDGVRFSTKGN
jgi:hypothetical protein